MGSYLRQDFSAGWVPSNDAFGAPPNSLLRADNLVLDERGALALRQGSVALNATAFTDTDVHSLATFSLSGTRHRMSGCTDSVYDNGTVIESSLDGTGDISFGSHLGQILFARGTTKRKYDGTTLRTWGIDPPAAPPTLAVLPPDSKTFASCDSTELPVMTSNEGTQTFVTDRFNRANGAMQIVPDATTGRGMSTKTFTTPQDFTVYNAGGNGSPRDLIDLYVYITEPQLTTGITVMIDVSDGTFQNGWFDYTFFQGDAIEIVPTVADSLESHYDVEGIDRLSIEAILGTSTSSTLNTNATTVVGWNHFQVPRSRMVPHGVLANQGWNTVMAVRVIVLATTGGSGSTVKFDDINIIGAGGLTGKYTVRVVAAYPNGTYEALSGPSDISNEMQFTAQNATVTVDADTINALDAQVTQIWAYIMGGHLDAFYRAATADRGATAGAFDHTAGFETAFFTALAGIANFTKDFEVNYGGKFGPKTHTASWESAYLVISDPWSVDITETEVDILIENERLETDNTVPPDDIIGIEGPHFDRTLCLTEEFLYPSRELDPDAYSQGEVVRVGDASEQALWIKKLDDSSVYVGTTKDIYRLDGDWTPQPDESINVIKRPMHTPNPPISSAVAVGKINGINTLIYLAGNGWTILGGGTLTDSAVDLLWRGFTRHDVQPVNITSPSARFRAAVSKNVLFAITPESPDTTSSAVLHVYHFTHQRWYRFVYPQAFRSIHCESDGTLIAGDVGGFIQQLDLATKQDNGVNIPVDLRTPIDDNGEPFTYKDPENFWMRCDTAGDTATVAFHINGAGTGAASATTTTALVQTGTGNQDMSACPEFTQLQLRITGSFSTFVLRQWGLRYIDNPLPQVIHDTGPIDLSVDALKWVRRIKIKAKSPVDLTIQPYWDGTAGTARTISIDGSTTDNLATVYTVPLGRQDYGRVGRIVITSAQPSHIYWVQFQFNGTGNQNQKMVTLQPEAA